MSDNEYLPTSKLKNNESNDDTKCDYSKLFKNKMGSRRSYYIVLTLLIFIFAVLILAVVGIGYSCLANVNRERKICTTKDCLKSATLFSESMNTSVNPCTDFYQFACGNFRNSHRIPKSSISNDRFAEVHATMMTVIRDFMEKIDTNTEPSSVARSRQLYRSCIATDEMDLVGIQLLVELIDNIGLPDLIGYNLKNSTKKKNQNLSSILANTKRKINLDYFFITSVEPDPKNRTINRISLGKPRDMNLFPIHKTTEMIKKMISRKMRETLASEEKINNENENDYDNELDELIKFEKSFENYFHHVWLELFFFHTNNSSPPDLVIKIEDMLRLNNLLSELKGNVYSSDEKLPIVMNVDELQSFTNNITGSISKTREQIIDWRQYFTILFMDINDVELDFKTHFIQISNIEYFKDLFELLVKLPKSKIITNIWWEVVNTLLPYTTNSMRFAQDRFYFETTGVEHNPSRTIYCANAVNSMMGMAVSHLLKNTETIDHNKKMAIEMMENIHWAFEKIVKDLKWMDDTTKQRTLNKAQQMRTFVGYPEFINENELLDEYYSGFEIIENNYFANVIHYVQRDLNDTLERLVEPNDYNINSWASDPLEVNAYNWIQANAITVPAGILQFPFFGHDLQVLNYGFLGSILGHELTHSFDNTGRKFDQDGNENMWWTNKTIQEYEKRTDCFIHHYESYLVPGTENKVNGKLTLDENIADNGGLRQALLAYRKFVADHGEESKLPGLDDFSNEQIYYLAFANNWCEASSYESLSNSLLDEHSPNYIRVIAGLTNSEEFSEIWKCEKGTTMNPSNEKCKIW